MVDAGSFLDKRRVWESSMSGSQLLQISVLPCNGSPSLFIWISSVSCVQTNEAIWHFSQTQTAGQYFCSCSGDDDILWKLAVRDLYSFRGGGKRVLDLHHPPGRQEASGGQHGLLHLDVHSADAVQWPVVPVRADAGGLRPEHLGVRAEGVRAGAPPADAPPARYSSVWYADGLNCHIATKLRSLPFSVLNALIWGVEKTRW
eukprot:CAMPEP_0194559308 /NCGR_PEP_ID=MMETSP0292-20121207/900_1 /TAXON_ID=39354 /ORGANISM="Heterosigma akashiwo, Strain CCMP2393" /LENGTH=201 /DNA_ID=CAMNT_0039407181 /DNA_START=279 /DNA_END=881 /DNA_ORIENTATION=+